MSPSTFSLVVGALLLAQPQQPAKVVAEGDRVIVGGREYVLRWFKSTHVGRIEKRGPFCLWKDGTAWVIDPVRPDLKDRFELPWPIDTLSADRTLALVRLPAKKNLLAVADVRKRSL